MMDIITSKIGNFNQQFCNILVDSFIASLFSIAMGSVECFIKAVVL